MYVIVNRCSIQTGMSGYVMYLVIRRDLVKAPLNWPFGAVLTQSAHAATAALWTFREDPNTIEYMKDIDHMHKVTLGVDSKEELLSVKENLVKKGIDHRIWIEDDMEVALAVKPYKKEEVKNAFRGIKLF